MQSTHHHSLIGPNTDGEHSEEASVEVTLKMLDQLSKLHRVHCICCKEVR